jgi:hypothetical protein
LPAPSQVQKQLAGAVEEQGVPNALPVQSATQVAAA